MFNITAMLGWPVTSCLTAYLRIYKTVQYIELVLGVSVSLQKGFGSGFMVLQLNSWGISTFFGLHVLHNDNITSL